MDGPYKYGCHIEESVYEGSKGRAGVYFINDNKCYSLCYDGSWVPARFRMVSFFEKHGSELDMNMKDAIAALDEADPPPGFIEYQSKGCDKSPLETKEITALIRCPTCVTELNGSHDAWARYQIGFTDGGLQLWCLRHGKNVLNLDFKNQTATVGKACVTTQTQGE